MLDFHTVGVRAFSASHRSSQQKTDLNEFPHPKNLPVVNLPESIALVVSTC